VQAANLGAARQNAGQLAALEQAVTPWAASCFSKRRARSCRRRHRFMPNWRRISFQEKVMSRFVFFETPRAVVEAAAPLYAELAAMRMRLALARLMLKYNFDPGQPRVPAGSSEGGRWTDAGGSGWRRVAANDRGEGGIATDVQPLQKNTKKLRKSDAIPADAVTFKAPDGTSFLAPSKADFEKVYADGQALKDQDQINWVRYIGGKVGQFGEFDFQRRGDIFYSRYTDASNYAAGLFMSGAGFSYRDMIAIASGYAITHSTGGVTTRRIRWWTYGYLAGYLKAPLTPLPLPTKSWAK
jgi:hypothetical protein